MIIASITLSMCFRPSAEALFDSTKWQVGSCVWSFSTFNTGAQIPVSVYKGFGYASRFPGGAGGKEPACQCRRHKRHGFDPRVRGKEGPLEEGKATHSSILAWRIP